MIAKRFLLWITITLLLQSCEEDITLNLPLPESEIVVEGYIELNKRAYVTLTKSSAYFEPIDSSVLLQYLIHNAIITVSDGILIDTLIEKFDPLNYPTFPYVYESQNMIGEAGKTYQLNIYVQGKNLHASTSIPEPIPLDSLWFVPDEEDEYYGFLWCHLTDPPTLGNNYRIFTKRLNQDLNFIPALFGSVFEDKFINDKSFDFYILRGHPPNSTAAEDTADFEGFFKQGDSIVVKWCTLDRQHFEFWRSLEIEANNNGNPFASPVNVPTNINDGLGIWGGYGTFYDTLIVK